MFYITSTPWWLKLMFPSGLTWKGEATGRRLYLTFDDGPHPEITSYVLNELKAYNAKGTFFCIGENVERYPRMYQTLVSEGHRVGNHTHTHPDGWKMNPQHYLDEIKKAAALIDSNLFRPPYGKITKTQVALIKKELPQTEIIMWSGVTGDFDTTKTGAWCAKQALGFAKPGNIVVFHDSEKAFPRLREALPAILRYAAENNLQFGIL